MAPLSPAAPSAPGELGAGAGPGDGWGAAACGPRGDRALSGTAPVLFLTSQGRGLLRGSGLALLTMKILLVLPSSESRKDSRARQRSRSCGGSASWSQSLVPGEKRTQCQRGGLGTWQWQPGARAQASLAGRGHARAELGAALPGRARALALRAGGTARQPAERQPGSLGRVSPAEERGAGGLVLAWLCRRARVWRDPARRGSSHFFAAR